MLMNTNNTKITKKLSNLTFLFFVRSTVISKYNNPNCQKIFKRTRKNRWFGNRYTSLKFDLKAISNMMPQTKGVSFNSTDAGVSSKSFSGDEVDVNDEAIEALDNDEATKIIGTLDILGRSRTIMLTQSGTILSFTSLTDLSDQKEYPMLEFAIATLMTIGMLH